MDMDKLGYFVYMQSQEQKQKQETNNSLLPQQNNVMDRQQLSRGYNVVDKKKV